jgi:multicomponent Na+:H+ antiporter subunit D
MNNAVVLPLLIPLCTAVLLVFLKNRLAVQRKISAYSALLNTACAVWLVYLVRERGIQTLHMGGWAPPYGIVFVADMLAALLVLATSIVVWASLFFAFSAIGEKRERYYFYPFVQFLLAGVNGSFLTGDMFNLYVCFEVLLISSYALIVLGGTRRQLRETLKYILVNIVSSALFVAALAFLYAVSGTLNMAHLSERVAEAGQGGLFNTVAVLFLAVFSLKAGLFLFYWLPGSYSAPPAAVTVLFGALLTKVGVYAIIRMFTLVFYHDPGWTHELIGWMAGATMILGALGAAASTRMTAIMNYNIVISIGFIAAGVAAAVPQSQGGAVFYLLHDMVAKALLFMLGGIIIAASGTDRLADAGGLFRRYKAVGWMFFVLIFALVGVPPLSGFAGKLMIVRGSFEAGRYWLGAIGIASSLVILYSLMKLFMKAFWGDEKPERERLAVAARDRAASMDEAAKSDGQVGMDTAIAAGNDSAIASAAGTIGDFAGEAAAAVSDDRTGARDGRGVQEGTHLRKPAAAAFALFAVMIAFGLGSEWVYGFVSQAEAVLAKPELYIEAVLKGAG